MQNKFYVTVGESVPIKVQLKDGSVGRKVFVTIFDDVVNRLAKLPLIGGENGLYFTNFYKMPDVPHIVAQINVEGVDALGQEYELASGLFYSQPKVLEVPKVYLGQLIFKKKSEKIFVGVFREAKAIK